MILINLDCLSVDELRCVAKNRRLHLAQRVYASCKATAMVYRLAGSNADALHIEDALDRFYSEHVPADLRW